MINYFKAVAPPKAVKPLSNLTVVVTGFPFCHSHCQILPARHRAPT